MSEHWVVGRYIDGRWEWLANERPPFAFVEQLDDARRFIPFDANDVWDRTSTNECIMHIDAARAIEERWEE